MIKFEKDIVTIESEGPAEMVTEFSAIARVVRKEITECLGPEIAEALMQDAMWLSGLDKEELAAAEQASTGGIHPRTGEKLNV